MSICPKCQAENRPEAAFCARCGTILFAQPAHKPTEQVTVTPVPEQEVPGKSEPTPVAPPPKFQPRKEGSIFGDRFAYNALVFQTEHENCYTVTDTPQAGTPMVQICSNPECRTVHLPVGPDAESFCTQCGKPLDGRTPVLLLSETDDNRFSSIQPVIDLHIVHPNVHPPVATFIQAIPGDVRYYLVTPYSQDLPTDPSEAEVVEWVNQLAQALDYLQSKGIAFGDQFSLNNIGKAESRVVWRDFTSVRILPVLADREKINNVRLLALAMYSWMTGETTYSMDPYLPPALNELFQKALVGEGFTSGEEFVRQIELAKSAGLKRLVLDYQVGKRTHPGMVRTHNEDSLLTIQLSNFQDGLAQPLGVFAIADGMGGHASGELASSLVIQSVAQKTASELVTLQNPAFDAGEAWLKQAMDATNQAVFQARMTAENDMGSTLALGLLIGSQAHLANLGDSRIYLVNREGIKQLSTDHSLVQHMVSMGQITPEEARSHPQRNVIFRSLGEKAEFEADYLTQQLFPGDMLLFCSDGLNSLVDEQQIHKITLESSSPQAACDRLIDTANQLGGDDNISVIIVEVVSY